MFFKRKRKEETASTAPEAPAPAAAGLPEAASRVRDSGPPSTQFLTGEAGQDRRTVQVLLEAIARVSESRDLESLLIDIVDRSIEITGAERGLLIMKRPGTVAEGGGAEDDEGPESLDVRVFREKGRKSPEEELRFSTSVAHKVLKEVTPIRATVHSDSEALELGRSVYDLKLRAVMCVPLTAPKEDSNEIIPPKGVLYVDSRAATRQFNHSDLALFAALAQHISIAMENARLHIDSMERVRLEQSLELASVIQRDLMPQIPAGVPGWDVHGWYGPAEAAAGDFYDFVKMKDGKLAIVVGDVTGHGIGPALITASAQASLRAYLKVISDPDQVVTELNQDLCDRVEDGRFLTLFMAMLSPDGTVRGLNGGHALPFVWRRETGTIETIEGGGPALGMIPGEEYVAHPPIRLDAGDVLIVYTDGLTEARHPDRPDELLGEEGVKAVLEQSASAGKCAKEICVDLVEAAMRLSGNRREDDITVVVARRL